MSTVNSKEEAREKRVEYGRFAILEEDHRKWSRYCKVEGDELVVYAQPFVVKRLSEEEKQRREDEARVRKEAFQKRLEESKAKKLKAKEDVAERKACRKADKIEKLETELAKAKGE